MYLERSYGMENRYDMPIGLSFQLGLNEKALSVYAKMDESEKKQVVEAARNVSSKAAGFFFPCVSIGKVIQ